jgi:hypothetical protein
MKLAYDRPMRTPRACATHLAALGGLLASALLGGCTGDITAGGQSTGSDGQPSDPPAADASGPAPGDPDAALSGEPDGAAALIGCDDPGLLFCDDFEGYPLGPATSTLWTPESSNGSLTIDSEQARGAAALHVHTDGNGRAAIRLTSFAPPDNGFFARMYLRADAFPSAPDFAHFTLVEASGSGGGGFIRPIGGQYVPAQVLGLDTGLALWGVGSDGGPTGDWTSWQPEAPAEADRWICLEWQLEASDSRIDVWIDGVAHPELSVSRDSHGGNQVDFSFPTFDSIWFGWQLYQGGPTPSQFDLWLDDIALSTTRIGC